MKRTTREQKTFCIEAVSRDIQYRTKIRQSLSRLHGGESIEEEIDAWRPNRAAEVI